MMMYPDQKIRKPRKDARRRPSMSSQNVLKMDPDCAVCFAPAITSCNCEANLLEKNVRDAEQTVMKTSYQRVREWARSHAQDRILQHFRRMSEIRNQAHRTRMNQIHAYAQQYYNADPHPNTIAKAQNDLKRHLNEDWQQCVLRYPEVLQYFFSLVTITLPSDTEIAHAGPLADHGDAATTLTPKQQQQPHQPQPTPRRRQINSAPPPPRTAPPMDPYFDDQAAAYAPPLPPPRSIHGGNALVNMNAETAPPMDLDGGYGYEDSLDDEQAMEPPRRPSRRRSFRAPRHVAPEDLYGYRSPGYM